MRRLVNLAIVAFVLMFLWNQIPAARAAVEAPIQMAHGLVASVELHNLQKMIIQQKLLNGAYPAPESFAGLVRDNFQSLLKNPGIDGWGRPYLYRVFPAGFELRSAGPDRRFATNDDLVILYKEPAR